MAEGLKIWQQNSFCVRDEPFVISLMNCLNDKPFTRTQQCLTTIWQLQCLRSLSGQRCWAGQSLSLLLQVAVVHCSSQHQSWKQEHLSLWSRYSCTGKSVPEKAPEWKHLKNRKANLSEMPKCSKSLDWGSLDGLWGQDNWLLLLGN